MADKGKRTSLTALVITGAILAGFVYFGRGYYHRAMTIHQLLTENKQLKEAITNLTDEDQIGYAKVLGKEQTPTGLITRIKFVETARDDKLKRVLEKEYEIPGDIVHFDALIVKFGNKMVMDGKARALYLWRRIYGDKTPPEQGFEIQEPGAEPQRYADLLAALPIEQRNLFWSSIWDLANDRKMLEKHDIHAIFGNVNYLQLREGLIYVFKIDATGQIFPEVVPDM